MRNLALNFKNAPLPIPPMDYSPEHFRQLIRVLEIYFNQLNAWNLQVYNALSGASPNQIVFPHIAASDSTDQLASGNDTPTVVKFNTLDSGFGWTLNSPGSATAAFAGVYKITYSIQFSNTANAIHDAVVWLRVNGNDITNSATFFSIPARKSAGVPSFVCGYSEVVFEVAAGDEIELYWATDLAYDDSPSVDGIYLYHEVAQTTPYAHPAVPSVIGSITYVSATST